jgi:uncharacterized protein
MGSAESGPPEMRRRDRAVLDERWIRAALQRAGFGTLAMVRAGRPEVNVNTFVYDEERGSIYFHTARHGRTRENLEADPAVCFVVAEMGRVLPADTAMEFSVEYGSVVVYGSAAVVDDEAEARRALQMLLDKYAPHLRPGVDYRATTASELALTAVFRISIESWTAKGKQAEVDFPGAYPFSERPPGQA